MKDIKLERSLKLSKIESRLLEHRKNIDLEKLNKDTEYCNLKYFELTELTLDLLDISKIDSQIIKMESVDKNMVGFNLKDEVIVFNETTKIKEIGIIVDFFIDYLTLKYIVKLNNGEYISTSEENLEFIIKEK